MHFLAIGALPGLDDDPFDFLPLHLRRHLKRPVANQRRGPLFVEAPACSMSAGAAAHRYVSPSPSVSTGPPYLHSMSRTISARRCRFGVQAVPLLRLRSRLATGGAGLGPANRSRIGRGGCFFGLAIAFAAVSVERRCAARQPEYGRKIR